MEIGLFEPSHTINGFVEGEFDFNPKTGIPSITAIFSIGRSAWVNHGFHGP